MSCKHVIGKENKKYCNLSGYLQNKLKEENRQIYNIYFSYSCYLYYIGCKF